MKPGLPHHQRSVTVYKYRSMNTQYWSITCIAMDTVCCWLLVSFPFPKICKIFQEFQLFFLTVFLDLEFIYLKESPCHTWSRARLRPAPGSPSHTSPPPPPCTPCPGWSHHTRCTRDPLFWSPSHRLEDLCRWDTCPPPAPHTSDTENSCMCQSNILTCSTKMPQKQII